LAAQPFLSYPANFFSSFMRALPVTGLNLEHIARLSGVSRSTVSRVINNDPKVADETRAKVQQVIEEVHFRPNVAARSLAGAQTFILGLVIPTGVSSVFSDPYFPNLIRGISSACRDRDYSVMLWLAEPDYERRTVMQVLRNGIIDGVIVSSMPMDEIIVDALSHAELPFILVGRDPTHPGVNYVDVENRRGGVEAVTHLIRMGRRRIAHISGPLNTVVGRDRLEGFQEALRMRGVPFNPELVLEGDFSEEEGYSLTKLILPRSPDAIFAASDAMALGALRALREAGLRVPEDVAVIGFDDLPFAATADPPLTTIRQPIQRTGAMAAQTLIDIIEHPGEAPVRRILLPTELVIRKSCGAILPENP
jgi:LacI family transcriptional regulator